MTPNSWRIFKKQKKMNKAKNKAKKTQASTSFAKDVSQEGSSSPAKKVSQVSASYPSKKVSQEGSSPQNKEVSPTFKCECNTSIYNQIRNADTTTGIQLLVNTLVKFIDDINQDIACIKQDIACIKQDIASIKKDLNNPNTNVGCLYELQVKNEFEKEYILEWPMILQRKQFPKQFFEVDANSSHYTNLYNELVESKVMSLENATVLDLFIGSVEINVVRKETQSKNDTHIIEVTMSSFTNDCQLICKLLQLERQVLYYRACYPNDKITTIGLVSPSSLTIDRIKGVVEKYSNFVIVRSFLESGNFKVHRHSNTPI